MISDGSPRNANSRAASLQVEKIVEKIVIQEKEPGEPTLQDLRRMHDHFGPPAATRRGFWGYVTVLLLTQNELFMISAPEQGMHPLCLSSSNYKCSILIK